MVRYLVAMYKQNWYTLLFIYFCLLVVYYLCFSCTVQSEERMSDEALAILTTPGKVTESGGLAQLEHTYAEGTDFTLTDLILFPCVTSFIVSECGLNYFLYHSIIVL